MEHIKIKSRIHILKRTGWAILLVSMILAGGIRAQDTFSSRDPKVYGDTIFQRVIIALD